jgi:hypothetical protein
MVQSLRMDKPFKITYALLITKNYTWATLGVKTERIWTDSSETVFVTIFFSDSESERIVCGYEYGIGVYR